VTAMQTHGVEATLNLQRACKFFAESFLL
jgi:hypothetical protein